MNPQERSYTDLRFKGRVQYLLFKISSVYVLIGDQIDQTRYVIYQKDYLLVSFMQRYDLLALYSTTLRVLKMKKSNDSDFLTFLPCLISNFKGTSFYKSGENDQHHTLGRYYNLLSVFRCSARFAEIKQNHSAGH